MQEGVLIGSDSMHVKMQRVGVERFEPHYVSSGCKDVVNRSPFKIYAAGSAKLGPAFFVDDVIAKNMPPLIGFDAAIELLQKVLSQELTKALSASPLYRKIIKDRLSGSVLSVLVGGGEKGVAKLATVDFKLQDLPRGQFKIAATPTVCPSNDSAFCFQSIGENSSVDLSMNETRGRMPIDRRIKKALEVQAFASPKWVGSPFSIVSVSRLGVIRWVETGLCAADKK